MHICKYTLAFMRGIDWDDLRFFLAVAAAGSLSAAARELNVNTTTVLRRIASLEEALDARLFERLRSGYELTQEGARLTQTLEPVDASLSSLARDFKAGSEHYRGIVRLGVSEVVASRLIAPSLSKFAVETPDVELVILTDASLTGPGSAPRVVNAMRDVDIALRLARPTQGDMLVRKLVDVAYGLYASTDYLAHYGPVSASGDLSGHQIIGFSQEEQPLGPIWWLSRAEKNGQITMRASSAMTRATAAQAGLGLAALPCFLADGIPDLQRQTGPDLLGALELWLLTRSDLARLPHVRAVMDFLIAEVQANNRLLVGLLPT